MAVLKRLCITTTLLLAQGSAALAAPLSLRLGGFVQPQNVSSTVVFLPAVEVHGGVGLPNTPWRLGGLYQAQYLHIQNGLNQSPKVEMTHLTIWAGYEHALSDLVRLRLLAGGVRYKPETPVGLGDNIAASRQIAALPGTDSTSWAAMAGIAARFQSGPIWLELTPNYTFGTESPNSPWHVSGLPLVAMGYRLTPHLEIGFRPLTYSLQADFLF